MSRLLFTLLTISLIATVTILVRHTRREPRAAIFLLGLTLALGTMPLLTLPLPFTETAVARGQEQEEMWFLLVLYGCLLLGMLAQYLYKRFSRPRRQRPKFDVGLFLAPIFTSPIIFIPLLAAVQAAEVDLYQADSARLMLFLVAFENGFFWKVIFDQRQQLAAQKK